ncbi:unnamed protein product [Moneuplotes crassus]|uniref:Transmembrane protein 135 N-terminal domain-containing protein n=1 Tax=Euplotes crassus TaxID=5936 RepID=A0AAD1XK95_EUPCR|nr:unnamed protein product [Moneuplotes crassus]
MGKLDSQKKGIVVLISEKLSLKFQLKFLRNEINWFGSSKIHKRLENDFTNIQSSQFMDGDKARLSELIKLITIDIERQPRQGNQGDERKESYEENKIAKSQDLPNEANELKEKYRKLLCNRDQLCSHKNGCIKNSFKGLLRNFAIGFGLNAAKIILFGLLRPAKFTRNFTWKNLLSCARLGAFLGLWNFSYKALLCMGRRLFKSDKISSVVAGAISALSLAIEEQSQRETIALYLFARSTHAMALKLENDGITRNPDKGEVMFCTICVVGVIMISMYHVGNFYELKFRNFKKSLNKIVFTMLVQKNNDKICRLINYYKRNKELNGNTDFNITTWLKDIYPTSNI